MTSSAHTNIKQIRSRVLRGGIERVHTCNVAPVKKCGFKEKKKYRMNDTPTHTHKKQILGTFFRMNSILKHTIGVSILSFSVLLPSLLLPLLSSFLPVCSSPLLSNPYPILSYPPSLTPLRSILLSRPLAPILTWSNLDLGQKPCGTWNKATL